MAKSSGANLNIGKESIHVDFPRAWVIIMIVVYIKTRMLEDVYMVGPSRVWNKDFSMYKSIFIDSMKLSKIERDIIKMIG